MSIHFSGALRRSAGARSAIGKQVKMMNLKAVKRITVTFDPFKEDVKATREFLFLLSIPRVAFTNPNCVLKTNVVCNRQPSEVLFSLIDDVKDEAKVNEIRFKSDKLTTLELVQLCNKYITALAPKETPLSTLPTKGQKQKVAGSKIKRK